MKGRIGHLDDWVAGTPESIAARLESARSAQGQARRTMGLPLAHSHRELAAFFWFRLVVFFVCWIPLVTCCCRSRLYSEATGRVLKEYGTRLRADLLRHQSIASQRFTQSAVSRIS